MPRVPPSARTAARAAVSAAIDVSKSIHSTMKHRSKEYSEAAAFVGRAFSKARSKLASLADKTESPAEVLSGGGVETAKKRAAKMRETARRLDKAAAEAHKKGYRGED